MNCGNKHGRFFTRFYDFFNIKGHIVPSRDRCEYCKEWLN